jgi:hypothetical protein
MTTQGAGPPTDGSQLDLDEADRLAESIRPAWETEDSHDKSPAAAAGATPSGAEPPRDTVIDGAPLMPVGKTDPGRTDPAEPLRSSRLEPAKRPVPPKPAKATVMGLGASDEVVALKNAINEATEKKPANGPAPESAGETKESAKAAEPPPAKKDEVTMALPVKNLAAEVGSDALDNKSDEAPASRPSKSPTRSKRKTRDGAGPDARDSDRGRRSAASAAPAGSAGVSFSKVDDPVELPVEKSSKGLYIGGALALVGVLVVGGLLSMGGDDAPKQPAAPAKTQASEPAPAKQPDPKPTATEAKQPEPAPAPTPTETAAATAAPTAEPAATPEPLAKKDPPPTKPTGNKAPPSGGSGQSKPAGGGGGKKGSIMRDAPF